MISLKNITFAYGSRKILEDVSISASDGEFIAVLGANGAGKSTLLRIASGALRAKSGIVEINGLDVAKTAPRNLAKFRAVLEQESALDFDYTALETVLLGRYAHNMFPQNSPEDISLAEDCLKRVGMCGAENRLYTQLSGGEKQRIQLARALCQIGKNPRGKILMLDEPSASLDPAHAHAAMRAAKDLCERGAAVISILHDPNLAAAYATKIALLKDSKILSFDTPEKSLTETLLGKTYNAPCKIFDIGGKKIIYFPEL